MTEEMFTGIYTVTVIIAFFFLSWNERRDAMPSDEPGIDDADFYMLLFISACWPLVVVLLLVFAGIDKWKQWVSNDR